MGKTIESTDESWEAGALGSDERFARVSKLTKNGVGEAMNNDTGQAANPMSAFVGVNFDCEFLTQGGEVLFRGELSRICGKEPIYYDFEYGSFEGCRPRLNKAQVLDLSVKENRAILVDGFVWEYFYMKHVIGYGATWTHVENSEHIRSHISSENLSIFWIKFIGVEANKGLDAWAKANDVPVVTL